MMEKSTVLRIGTGYKHRWYSGAGDASYENVPLVDDNGKKLPVAISGWGVSPQSMDPPPQSWETIREGVLKGEYALPFYGDFPSMPKTEQKATWNMLLSEESATKIIVDTYTKSGFDPSKDQLQNYQLIEGSSPPHWRAVDIPVCRWNTSICRW
jgi:hypothetical protein